MRSWGLAWLMLWVFAGAVALLFLTGIAFDISSRIDDHEIRSRLLAQPLFALAIIAAIWLAGFIILAVVVISNRRLGR